MLDRVIYSTAESVIIMDYKQKVLKTIDATAASLRVQNDLLWIVSMKGDDYIEVSIFDPFSFEELDTIKAEDEGSLFDASVSVEDGPDKNSIILSIGQGQDGYWNNLVQFQDGKLTSDFFGGEFYYPVVFNEEGSLFLLVDEHGLCVLSFPDEDIINQRDFAELSFVHSYEFITDSTVLFLAQEGLFVWNVENDEIEEVIVAGFEPRIETYPLNPGVEDCVFTDMTDFSLIDGKVYIGVKTDDEVHGVLELDSQLILERRVSS